jgi:methionine-rich copper-binding protein CopC
MRRQSTTLTGRRGVRRVAAAIVAVLVLLVLLVTGTAPAAAHTDLVGSTPGPGDTVSPDTNRLVLVFGGPVAEGSSQVVVLDDHGLDAVDGSAAVSGQTLEVPLRLQRSGRHEVTYRVVSEDGHAIVGTYEFDVRSAASGTAPSTPPPSGPPEITAGAGTEQTGSGLPPALWAVGGIAVLVLGLVLARTASRSAQGHPATLGGADEGVRVHAGEG